MRPDAAPAVAPDPAPDPAPDLALDPRDRKILEFERDWWRDPTSKARRVRECFGISPARYQQLLNRAIDRPEALAFDPMLVRRLLRLRDGRRRRRVADRLGVRV